MGTPHADASQRAAGNRFWSQQNGEVAGSTLLGPRVSGDRHTGAMQGQVTVTVEAPPEVVFALVSDVTRIGEFSPETFDAEWLDGATGPAVGARFRGHVRRNERGPVYWTTCTVVECEPERAFGFTVDIAGRAVNRWTYRLRPVAEGTEVTESFELAPTLLNRVYWAAAGRWRARTNARGMKKTLTRIKAVAEGARTP